MSTLVSQTREHSPSSSVSEISDILNLKDDEGWEDAETEEETETIRSLLDDKFFPDVPSMLRYCKDQYNFSFIQIRDKFSLDFYGTIKLVNYIRSEVKHGRLVSSDISIADFEADEYLKPVFEDDTLLYNLGDLPEVGLEQNTATVDTRGSLKLLERVAELEDELRKTQFQFCDYQNTVRQTLDRHWNETVLVKDPLYGVPIEDRPDEDSYYFNSYSYNGMFSPWTLFGPTVSHNG